MNVTDRVDNLNTPIRTTTHAEGLKGNSSNVIYIIFLWFSGITFKSTSTQQLTEPPDAWVGRAAVDWTKKLAKSKSFDPEVWNSVRVAEAIDRIYQK